MALLLWGCDTTAKVPAKPTVVRKKIVAPKGNTAKVGLAKTVRPVDKKPAGNSRTQTAVAKVDQTQAVVKNQPAAKKNTDARSQVAKVVRKKIAVPKADRTDGKKPVVKPQTQTVVAKVDRTQAVVENQPTAKKNADARRQVAKVVRKKIVAPKNNSAEVNPPRADRTVSKKAVGKPLTETVVAKVDQTQAGAKKQPAAINSPDARTLIASNRKYKPVPSEQLGKKPAAEPLQGNSPSLTRQKKPAISPKSEITEIKQAAKNQTQSTGSKTVAGTNVNTAKLAAANAPNSLEAGNLPLPYNPKGKIDPFEPLVREMPAAVKKKKNIKRKPRTPLERIALSQLKLTAIILASSGNRALVEETSGKGYVVKEGTYIGINGGKISNIKKEIVIVEERFEDFSGKIQTRKRELKLPKPPGEF